MSYNVICISIHIIYAVLKYTDIYLQQPKGNRVYYAETICILNNFLYCDIYFDDCIMVYLDTSHLTPIAEKRKYYK